MMSDAGSLQNLNDLALPAAVAWLPPAPGWYVLGALLAGALITLVFRWWLARRSNRYRVQALRELSSIRKASTDEALQDLPMLIKRAALAAWPREQVASLSGAAWHHFLDESARTGRFSAGAGPTLDQLAYRTSGTHRLSPSELQQALEAVEFWLKNHLPPEAGR